MESLAGEGVHGEIDLLSNVNHANITLGDLRLDLHFGQIIGDDKECWRIQARGHCLPNIHVAHDDDPTNRRANRAARQIDFRFCEIGLADLCQCRRLVHIGTGLVVVR